MIGLSLAPHFVPRWEASLAAKGLDFQKSPSSDFIWRDLSRFLSSLASRPKKAHSARQEVDL